MTFLRRLLALVMGEAAVRIAGVLLFMAVARVLLEPGVHLLQIAQTAAAYVIGASDLGFKAAGARLIAHHPGADARIIADVQQRRLTGMLVALPVALVWAVWSFFPGPEVWLVMGMCVACVPAALTADWVYWGRAEMGHYAVAKAIPFLALAVIGGAWLLSAAVLQVNSTTMGLAGCALGWGVGWFLAWWWCRSGTLAGAGTVPGPGWGAATALGLATLANQIYHTSDVLVLSSLRPAAIGAEAAKIEIGHYIAATKVVFLVHAGFYLITQAIFPALARAQVSGRDLWRNLGATLVLGLVAAVVVWVWAPWLLHWLCGERFVAATAWLRILTYNIPLEFLTAYLGTLLVASGRDRANLAVCMFALAVALGGNLWFASGHGPVASAWIALATNAVALLVLTALLLRGRLVQRA